MQKSKSPKITLKILVTNMSILESSNLFLNPKTRPLLLFGGVPDSFLFPEYVQFLNFCLIQSSFSPITTLNQSQSISPFAPCYSFKPISIPNKHQPISRFTSGKPLKHVSFTNRL